MAYVLIVVGVLLVLYWLWGMFWSGDPVPPKIIRETKYLIPIVGVVVMAIGLWMR